MHTYSDVRLRSCAQPEDFMGEDGGDGDAYGDDSQPGSAYEGDNGYYQGDAGVYDPDDLGSSGSEVYNVFEGEGEDDMGPYDPDLDAEMFDELEGAGDGYYDDADEGGVATGGQYVDPTYDPDSWAHGEADNARDR